MRLHVFVAMPFGKKPDSSGQMIDFDRVFQEFIKPALAAADLEVMRADQETRAGDICVDMFQELLMADLVVVDLTLDNPNVWYELGVRHALKAGGVVLIQGPRPYQPFDIYTSRKLNYRLKDGAPDPATLVADQNALTTMAQETLKSHREHKVSPVYNLLPNLQEPAWDKLKIGSALAFWDQHDAWLNRIALAAKANRPEDILVLANEIPVTALRAQAKFAAGKALVSGQHYHFALEQFEQTLAYDPGHRAAAQKKGLCLQRIGKPDLARQTYEKILADDQKDAETWGLLGRLDKDAWLAAWNSGGADIQACRASACDEEALLRAAIRSYLQGFSTQPGHYYTGINALTLMYLHQDLTQTPWPQDELDAIAGGVAWAARCESDPSQKYWALATLGDLALLRASPIETRRVYKEAIAQASKDRFSLDSTLSQILLLERLGFQPEHTAAARAVFEKALSPLGPSTPKWSPRQVFLFSGHMMDAPGRPTPRFPPEMEALAAQAIATALDEAGAGPEDLALSQGAAGGDILFAEACLQRGLKFQMLLPFPEAQFIAASILPSSQGEAWRKRFFTLQTQLPLPVRVMPEALGPLPQYGHGQEADPYERCNLWLLNSALTQGLSKVRFICLWNGGGGDGPGGTAHMVKEVQARTGRVTWLDTRKLW